MSSKPKATSKKIFQKLQPDQNPPSSSNDSEEVDQLTQLPTKPKSKTSAPGNKKSASQTYQEVSNTYIGSIEAIRKYMWIYDKAKKTKIVDEILVNADNKQRDDNMDTLKVTIDSEKNIISIMNNGKGIPIEIHETEGIYIPELIFGHLLVQSNFDDEAK
ncbi:hypothetical protein O181_121869 [Austropuccinia psidii MF-1]|uniref:DNA topoisomerase (ATP-hydrolyzing) n=1 Tax=Austropuccinia psidii MF-1 TaxID=1389203 RepID=A0A9Q3Q1S6_9BASI|nr:hypothetical protein [Austropuccinia psidii MF-1]